MWPFAQALTELRARLLADETGDMRVRYEADRQRLVPILRATDGPLRYEASLSLSPVADAAAPPLPSGRVYVVQSASPPAARADAGAPPARSSVAATVPMAVVEVGASAGAPWINRTPMALVAPPTVRRPGAPSRARWIAAAMGVPVLLGLGVAAWVLGGPSAAGRTAASSPPAPPPSTVPVVPPRASAPAASVASSAPPRPAAPPPTSRGGLPSRPKR
jgi:syndecan 1